jgi:hypothetical protein
MMMNLNMSYSTMILEHGLHDEVELDIEVLHDRHLGRPIDLVLVEDNEEVFLAEYGRRR